MDKGWYLRFSIIVAALVAAWFVIWPTLDANGWVEAPDFVTENIDRHITPGLDIQGGLRLMYTVDMDAAVRSRQTARGQQIRREMGEKLDIVPEGRAPNEAQLATLRERVAVSRGSTESRLIVLTFNNAADAAQLDHDLISSFEDLQEVERSGNEVRLALREESIDELRDVAVAQAQETIKNRITELGISEANVRARDIDISVEVPGANEEDFDRIREIIGQTAQLQFKIADDGNPFVTTLEDLPAGVTVLPETVSAGEDQPAVASRYLQAEGPGACPEGVRPDLDLRGEQLPRARLRGGEVEVEEVEGQCSARLRLTSYIQSLNQAGRIPEGRTLALGRADTDLDEPEAAAASDAASAWRTYLLHDTPPNGSDPLGGEHLEDASVSTDPQTNQPVVSFTIKTSAASLMEAMTEGNLKRRMAVVLDNEVQSAPVIQSRIGARGQITLGGIRDYNSLLNEANDLVIVLRAGALPAPIIPQNEQLIGPTLGADAVESGATGALVGICLVLLFMGLYYEVAGLVANLMVLLNLGFMVAIMAFFNNDLTLPGIAGIALTVGMAVDANVLITERMREEVRMGKSARATVDQGFRRAFWSIFDSQLTTFIAGVVLFQYGSPEIQGFAKTLMIGIATSLFTGYFCSKVMFDWLVRGLRVQRLRVG